MKKFHLSFLALLLMGTMVLHATEGITLTFSRTGTEASTVSVNITDTDGNAISGTSATLVSSSHSFKGTGGAITASVLCPNTNGNTSPTITMLFALSGLPENFQYTTMGVDLHALNAGGNYQSNSDGKQRKWSIVASTGNEQSTLAEFGALTGIDIASGVGSAGNVHKVWNIEKSSTIADSGTYYIQLTITATAASNVGCFIGLSQITLTTTSGEGEGSEEGEVEPELSAGIYNISWKNTNANHMTEGDDNSISVTGYDVTKRIFWEFIATDNENCFYIKNTATGRYISSCNLTPSSASRIQTSETPVEYYVKKTAATAAEIANCYYLSSTDCSGHTSEDNDPRALNKDGASSYVITWQAGTNRVGSYWNLIATEDLYEIRPFEPSSAIGSINISYKINSDTKALALTDGNITLEDKDNFADNQGWYFVGTTNREGYIIASTKDLTSTIATENGNITQATNGSTRWIVYESKEEEDKYYFKSGETTLKIGNDSLFTFSKQRSAYALNTQIYNNPCGYLADNYITSAKLHGDDVLKTITYEATSKPSTWHVLYTLDRGEVAIGSSFNLDIALAQEANNNLEIFAYFDWNADGNFETEQQMQLNGNKATGTFTAPEWAAEKATRMRVRVNENGLNYAEDDVEGVVYDFNITASPAMEKRTVTVGTNAEGRGTATLSLTADEYERGSSITATATPSGSNSFVCWKEGNIIVSTDAEYTFTIDHNITLTAYFTPDTTNGDDIITSIENAIADDTSIIRGEGYIQAVSNNSVTSMEIYTSNAMLAHKAKGDKIATGALPHGIYILKVRTTGGERNFKIHN